VYVDESGIDRTIVRKRARAPRGERVVVKRPGKKEKRQNVVAGLCNNKVISPISYDWATKAVWFEIWFEWYLCPLLPLNSVIIMDNASFHRKGTLANIAEFFNYIIIWLPPYSPDKNPIEHLWANLKSWLQYHIKDYPTLDDAIKDYFHSH